MEFFAVKIDIESFLLFVYDDTMEKDKQREEKLRRKEEQRRKKEEYKARQAQEKADNGFINALNGVSEKVWDDEEKN